MNDKETYANYRGNIMKKNIGSILGLCIIFGILISGCSNNTAENQFGEQRETLYQISTIQSLLAGNYDGFKTIGDIKSHGDFGIGTFDELDGELVMIDQKIYKVKDTGAVEEVEDSVTAPFVAVTFFDSDISRELKDISDYDALKQAIDGFIENKDSFYAIKVDAIFPYVKTRSVSKQEKPYPILSEVTKDQSVFEYSDVKGSLVGFWCPEYVGGINVPGYHLHFISDDRMKGGHLLEVKFENADLSLDVTNAFNMELPATSFSSEIQDVQKEIDKVE